MNVQDIMVAEVAYCSSQTSLQDIAMMMWNNDCGAIPIVDNEERPVGIVTDRDIAMAAALQHKPLWEINVEEVSGGRELFFCHPEDTIQEALALMEHNRIRRLLVINQFGQLCGMITMGDIVSFTQAGTASKSQQAQIQPSETLSFLKQVSGHHEVHHQLTAHRRGQLR